MFHGRSLLPNSLITNGPANLQCLAPKEVSFHSVGTFGPAGVVDLAVDPATGIGVTVKATDATRHVLEFFENSMDGVQDLVGLVVGYVELGIIGLLDLAFDNRLN